MYNLNAILEKTLGGFTGSLVLLDDFLQSNKDDIIGLFPSTVSGVKTRISTAVVVVSADGERAYVYKRTQEGEDRRGTPGKYDTFKGRVPYVAAGKSNMDESKIVGKVVNVKIAHEYNPSGKFAEFVFMPTLVFQVDQKSEEYLTSMLNHVPEDMGDVKHYEWVEITSFTSGNAMTKLL